MTFDIMTLFPHMVDEILSQSILGRARQAGFIHTRCHNIRDYTKNKHRSVDDTPYGGGAGMLMAAQPVCDCYRHVRSLAVCPEEKCRVIYLSPKGQVLTQQKVTELAAYDRLILLCGHYEGIDQRALDLIVEEEISVGDYVLTGGELPACILVDAVSRLQPGVLADSVCYQDESIAGGLLEYPQYTRPAVYEGLQVPSVLTSGNHQEIGAWRLQQSLALTKERRPELYSAYMDAHPPAPVKKKRGPRKKTEEPS